MLLSYAIVDFYLCYDGAVDMQIWALLTKSQCRVSDTLVTVKVRGPLVLKMTMPFALSYLIKDGKKCIFCTIWFIFVVE